MSLDFLEKRMKQRNTQSVKILKIAAVHFNNYKSHQDSEAGVK